MRRGTTPLVPTLCVGTQASTLCVANTCIRPALVILGSDAFATQSVEACIPTQSVGTRLGLFPSGLKLVRLANSTTMAGIPGRAAKLTSPAGAARPKMKSDDRFEKLLEGGRPCERDLFVGA